MTDRSTRKENSMVGRKRTVKLCPAAEKIIASIPPYIGLTGDALRALVERCVKAQRKHDAH